MQIATHDDHTRLHHCDHIHQVGLGLHHLADILVSRHGFVRGHAVIGDASFRHVAGKGIPVKALNGLRSRIGPSRTVRSRVVRYRVPLAHHQK